MRTRALSVAISIAISTSSTVTVPVTVARLHHHLETKKRKTSAAAIAVVVSSSPAAAPRNREEARMQSNRVWRRPTGRLCLLGASRHWRPRPATRSSPHRVRGLQQARPRCYAAGCAVPALRDPGMLWRP